MTPDDEARLEEARSTSIVEIADRLKIEGLKPHGHELVGPCPKCGGNDRFAIHKTDNVFNCRACGGGDGIRLVEHVLNCDFKDALDWLVGAREVQISPEELERRRKRREKADRRRKETAARMRAESIAMARGLWADGRPFAGSLAEDYLALRGIELSEPSQALRFHPSLRYMHMIDKTWVELHRGPAMLAGILAPSGDVIGVHRTWLDLSTAKGKAEIEHRGERLDAKKVLGSKKGGAIRFTPVARSPVLIMGEGIETTLSAQSVKPVLDAEYWCGVDLGNMAGRMRKVKGQRYSGLPDLDDEDAFLPPPWVERVIYLMDGDSEPKMTRAKLECGLRRAMAYRPDLRGQIVQAGDGVDFNDLLMGSEPGAERDEPHD